MNATEGSIFGFYAREMVNHCDCRRLRRSTYIDSKIYVRVVTTRDVKELLPQLKSYRSLFAVQNRHISISMKMVRPANLQCVCSNKGSVQNGMMSECPVQEINALVSNVVPTPYHLVESRPGLYVGCLPRPSYY